MDKPEAREEAIARIYTIAARVLRNAREVEALREFCTKAFGVDPPISLHDALKWIVEMREEGCVDLIVAYTVRPDAFTDET